MADLDLSGRTLGEFVLRERIGAGGHGTVYRCEQRALERDAVVKVLRHRVDARLEGHVGCVLSARWMSGGRVVTSGADGAARLWDGATGRLLQTYKGGPRFLADAVLMSGVVVGGDADGLLRFWDAVTGARLWTLPAHKSAVTGIHLEGGDIVTCALTGEISRWQLPDSGAVVDVGARSPRCAIVP